MADMKFLSGLDEEQLKNATIVAEQAKAVGIDPRLAVALAFTESRLRHSSDKGVTTSPKGAIGLMQVMPTTAEGLGYKKEDVYDPIKNTEIGAKYLKQIHDRYGGDPALIAAGYNAGPDHPFFTGKQDKLPAESINFVKQIRDLGGLEVTPIAATTVELKKEPSIGKPEEPGDFSTRAVSQGTYTPDIEYGFSPMQDILAGAGGAAVGALGGKSASALGDFSNRLAAKQAAAAAGSGALPRGIGPTGGGLVPTDPQNMRIGQGTTVEDTTGRARQTGYTEQTSAQAARKNAADKVIESLRQRGIVSGNPMAGMPGMTSTPGGVMVPQSLVYEQELARAAAPPPVAPASPGALSRAGSVLRTVASYPPIAGTLAGLGTAAAGEEAYQRYQKGDIPGAAVAGIGALGSAATLIPGGQVPGAIVSGAAPAALAVMDRYRNARKLEGPVAPATEAEMIEAQKPAFGVYPKPKSKKPDPSEITGMLMQTLDQQAAEFMPQETQAA